MKHEAVWMGTLLMASTLACRQAPTAPGVNAFSDPPSTQVLAHFQMQDIQAGTKYMVLDAIEGRMYENPAVTKLQQPVVTFYKNGAFASTLRAPEGQIFMESHEMQAWGGVTVVSSDSCTLTTDRMRYDPQKRHLLSDDPVRLEKPDSITEGIGLESEVDLSHVKIGHEKVTIKKVSRSKSRH